MSPLVSRTGQARAGNGNHLRQRYLIGLGTLNDRMLISVDIDKLMSSPEMGLIENIAT